MTTLRKIIVLSFYFLIVLIGVTFAVSNHERVDLTFWPLPYAFSMPIFLLAIFLFAIGILFGWTIARMAMFGNYRQRKESGRRIAALENELSGLRAEQVIRPAALSAH